MVGRAFRNATILGFNLLHVLVTSNVARLSGLRFIARARDHFAGSYGAGPRRD
jgi:hypothetical protein